MNKSNKMDIFKSLAMSSMKYLLNIQYEKENNTCSLYLIKNPEKQDSYEHMVFFGVEEYKASKVWENSLQEDMNDNLETIIDIEINKTKNKQSILIATDENEITFKFDHLLFS